MIIKRTNIPYSGRSIYGADSRKTVKRLMVANGTNGIGGGGLAIVTPTGTAALQLSVAVSNIYTTELPVTVDIDVIATVGNQRVPTYVQTENITGGYNAMTIAATDNGTDHAVINVTLPAGFNKSGALSIPVLVNAAVGADVIKVGTDTPTMEDAFIARTSTTKAMTCTWEWNILKLNSDGTITRGPILWNSNLARRFSNGQGPEEGDTLYMDLIKKVGDRNTYKCVTSYTQTAGQTWAQVSSNWQVDNSFSIIASGLIMGTDMTIEMRPDNEFFVLDSNNNHVVVIDHTGVEAVSMISTSSTTKTMNIVDSNDATVTTLGSNGITTSGTVDARTMNVKDSGNNTVFSVSSSGNVNTNGTLNAGATTVTSVTSGSLTVKDGSTTTATIAANGNISTPGTLNAGATTASSLTSGSLTVKNGTTTTATIAANGNISTPGTLNAGATTTSSLTSNELTLSTNGTNYATINKANGLTVGTVTADSTTTKGLVVKNNSNQTVVSISTDGSITAVGTVDAGRVTVGTLTATGDITTSGSVHAGTMNVANMTMEALTLSTNGTNYATINKTDGLTIGTVNTDEAVIGAATTNSVTIKDSNDNDAVKLDENGIVLSTLQEITVFDDNDDDVVRINASGIQTNDITSYTANTVSLQVKNNQMQTVTTMNGSGITTSGSLSAGATTTTSLTSNELTLSTNGTSYATINKANGLTVGTIQSTDITATGTIHSEIANVRDFTAESTTTKGFTVKSPSDQTVLTVSTAGDISANGGITATEATLGTCTAAISNVGTLNATGNITTVGTVQAARMSVGTINATGGITAQTASIGTLTATGNITTSGTLSAGAMNVASMTMQSLTLSTNGTDYATINQANGLTVNNVTTKGFTVKNNSNQTVMTVASSNGNITTGGSITASGGLSCGSLNTNGISATALQFEVPDHPEAYRSVNATPFNTDIAYITDDETMFDNSGTYWAFNDNDTHVLVENCPFLTVASREDVAEDNTLEEEQYYFTREEGVFDEASVPTGVYTSSHTVLTTRIYFQLDNQEIFVMGMNFSSAKP